MKAFSFFTKSSRSPDPDNRVIYLPLTKKSEFPSNKINTALYSPWSFIPLFLIGQFSKLANVYFLAIGLLEQIPSVSPVGRWITLVPLSMILLVSMLKEILEDIKRRTSDKTLNNLKCEVFTTQWRRIGWGDIQVGNFVRVSAGQTFPADVVLLATSEPTRTCYIQTSSLDGETNYKVRYCHPDLICYSNEDHWTTETATLCVENPNNNLYRFHGTIQIGNSLPLALDCDNVVLRGSQLKNTRWVIGLVIYTGSQTKIMLNSTRNYIKRSTVDYTTNWLVLSLMGILFCLTILCAVFYESYLHVVATKHFYFGHLNPSLFTFILSVATFCILFHNIIPISLMVTVEFVKMIQSYVISHDQQMYSSVSGTRAIVNTSSIIEELGQVNYIFTDKTGTLTCNEMILREISIGDKKCRLMQDSPIELSMIFKDVDESTFYLFIINLLVCNTVIPERGNDSEVSFQSSSPDETAMISALYDSNYKFLQRNGNEITIDYNGVIEIWTILTHINFTSERKRMSVIAQSPNGNIYLFMKGADVVVSERLSSNYSPYHDITFQNLESFAHNGLRTLCLAYKKISIDDCKNILKEFQQAYSNIVDRDIEVEKVSDHVERDLLILGATGIEDKLQENVPQTLKALRSANIKIWMLTGDKLETAINIGYSCQLLDQNVELVALTCNSIESCTVALKSILVSKNIIPTEFGCVRTNPVAHKNFSLVVTGRELAFALDLACIELFLDVVIHCRTVICCRVSPLQKKNMLLMIKQQVSDTITLAIGDGANDCSMIKAANVGVGIIGKEGMQAANTADFAIGEFSHLTRLLFVHGAASYRRICNCIYFCFYKNILFNLLPFFYDLFNMFSGQVVFSRVHMALFNVFYTSLPPLCFGLLDQSCSLEAHINVPYLYESMRKSYKFGLRRFSYWLLNGVLHSFMLFFICYALCHSGTLDTFGTPMSMQLFGTILFTHTLLVITLKASLEIRYWFWMTHVGICGGFLAYIIFLTLFCRRVPKIIWVDSEFLDIDILMYESPLFWFSLGIPVIVLFPDFLFHCIRNTWFTPSYLIITEMERQNNINWKEPDNITNIQNELDRSSEVKSKRSKKYFGFAFSMAETANIRKIFPRIIFKPKSIQSPPTAQAVVQE